MTAHDHREFVPGGWGSRVRDEVAPDLPAEAAVEAAAEAEWKIVWGSEDAKESWRESARAGLTAALPHLATVQPDRDDLAYMVLNATIPYRGAGGQTMPYIHPVHYAIADAMLAATPRRTVAAVKAEALREAAEAWDLAPGGVPKSWLRARADRIEAGETR